MIDLSDHAPIVARSYFLLARLLSRHAPNVLRRAAVKGLPADEAKAVAERGRWLPTLLGEGATNARGGVDEYRVMGAPWGFVPEDVTIPVHVFQGGADALVPEAWGRELARRIPGAVITCYPGEGHFIALTRRREVLEWLVGDLPAAMS